ncbi:MAG: ABC transporter substrate-binding protein [Cyanobacteriota bacterium]|nr:ABC transporter substrate-binding protein [Cyanobacteriota bacterium]
MRALRDTLQPSMPMSFVKSFLPLLTTLAAGVTTLTVTAFSGLTLRAAPLVDTHPPLLAQNQSLTPVKFTLSWLLQGVDAPLTTAIEKGYFAEEGLQVTFERGFGSADSIGKIAAGQYDLGFGDPYSMIEFNEKNPDQKLITIAVPYNKAPFTIISLKKSGINSPADLAGKKLGAPAGDAPRRLWPVFASQTGVPVDGVEWITMEAKLRETFLLQGQVDAISGFVYSALPSLIKGGAGVEDLNIFYYTDNGLDFYGNSVITRVDYAQKNPEVLKKFLKAYIRGIQDTIRDPAAGLATVLKADTGGLMQEADEKLRLQLVLDRLLINPEVEANGLATVDPVRFQKSIEQTVQGFGLASQPPLEAVFDDSFLPPKEERLLPPASERQSL